MPQTARPIPPDHLILHVAKPIEAPAVCRELGSEKVRSRHRGCHGRSLSWPLLLVLGLHHLHSGPLQAVDDHQSAYG